MKRINPSCIRFLRSIRLQQPFALRLVRVGRFDFQIRRSPLEAVIQEESFSALGVDFGSYKDSCGMTSLMGTQGMAEFDRQISFENFLFGCGVSAATTWALCDDDEAVRRARPRRVCCKGE
jgi:hypothetical protein